MKISKFTLYTVPPRWLFLKITTDEGLEGWGEPIVEGKAETLCSAVREMSDLLLGKNPLAIEDCWQLMYRGNFYRGGAVLMSAISGIDQALWDIKGKFYNAPVYELLGGPCRQRIDVYASVQADDTETLCRLARERAAEGYRALKVKASTHAIRFVDSMRQVTEIEERIGALREAVGTSVDIAVDFHGRIHKPMIKSLLQALEPYHLLFVEEPVPAGNHMELREIAGYTSAPVAIGERLYSRWDYRSLLEQGGADILQPDLSHAGGISECRKIANMAECYDVAVAPHCPIGPIAFAACLQLDSCIPNFCIQEQNRGLAYSHSDCDYILSPETFLARNGSIPVPAGPGLGIEIDEAQVRKMAEIGHRWRNPVWRDDAGAVAEW